MSKHFKYSKGLHILILCCFLLPFFNTSCESEGVDAPEEKEEQVAVKTDSALASDTSIIDSDDLKKFEEDTKSASTEKEQLFSEVIVEKAPVLKPVLNPSPRIYSGLATIIDSIPIILLFFTPIAFLLLLLSLTAKFIDKHARRTIVILDLLAFVFLLNASSMSWGCKRVWGVWVTISLIGALTIYDIYINRIIRESEHLKK